MRLKEQKNKFLDALDLAPCEYGTNFTRGNSMSIRRVWKKQRKDYGFDSRECYDLQRTYIEWLYSHLKMFLADAKQFVDLNSDEMTVDFQGDKYSVEQAINYIITNLEIALTSTDPFEQKQHDAIRNATLMWAEVFPYAWW